MKLKISKKKKKVLIIAGIGLLGVLLYMNSKGTLPFALPGFPSSAGGSSSSRPSGSASSSRPEIPADFDPTKKIKKNLTNFTKT